MHFALVQSLIPTQILRLVLYHEIVKVPFLVHFYSKNGYPWRISNYLSIRIPPNILDIRYPGYPYWKLYFTPLVSASNSGNLEIAKLLVQNGALVDIKNDKSFIAAPLSIASCRGHLEIAKLLLQNGADIECRGYNIKESSLYQAAK